MIAPELVVIAVAVSVGTLAHLASTSATVRIWQLTRRPAPWTRWRTKRRVRRSTALALASTRRAVSDA